MIELRTGHFTDLLPEHLRSREIRALAHAVGRQVERLLALADGTPFYAALSSAPERVLDYLAAELRTPAYSGDFPVEVKRTLIRDSLLAYAKMGTPMAVERTLSAVFGAGEVEEWFDYGGEPHHFRVCIPAAGGVTPEDLAEFRRVLGSVKRLSSWLDSVITVARTEPVPLRLTPVVGRGMAVTKLPELEPELPAAPLRLTPIVGRGFSSTRLPPLEPEPGTASVSIRAAAAVHTVTATRLPPAAEFETKVRTAASLGTSAAVHSVMETRLPSLKEESV